MKKRYQFAVAAGTVRIGGQEQAVPADTHKGPDLLVEAEGEGAREAVEDVGNVVVGCPNETEETDLREGTGGKGRGGEGREGRGREEGTRRRDGGWEVDTLP